MDDHSSSVNKLNLFWGEGTHVFSFRRTIVRAVGGALFEALACMCLYTGEYNFPPSWDLKAAPTVRWGASCGL